MTAVYLPGDSTADVREIPRPEPGHGEVLLAMKASTICGSDVRAIYREHLGHGAEAYQDVVAGHEPAGEVVALGPGCDRLEVGDRVAVYHIHGCGQCAECRRGYEISCTSSQRRAHGWQRDGGHAELMVAAERSCLVLPEPLTFLDGACVACGFGTAWEALVRADISGRDTLLVTGLGPVGLAVGLLARAIGVRDVVGVELVDERREWALDLDAVTAAAAPDDAADAVAEATRGAGATVAIDCSGAAPARVLMVDQLARWGRGVFVGEGGQVTLDVSDQVIHKQLTLLGSWVTSTGGMARLIDHLAAWQLHPEVVVTDRHPLAEADEAYEKAAAGEGGKVAIVPAG